MLIINKIDRVFCFIALLVFTGAVVRMTNIGNYDQGTELESGGVSYRFILALLYIISNAVLLYTLVFNRKFLRGFTIFSLISYVPLIIVIIIVLASTSWSASPSLTLMRGIALMQSTIFGIYFGLKFNFNEQRKIVLAVLVSIMVSSALLAVFNPGLGVESNGAWRGVMFTKNTLARMMSLGIVLLASMALERKRQRHIALGGVFFFMFVLVNAQSAGAMLITLALMTMMSIIYASRIDITVLVSVMLMLISIVIYAVIQLVIRPEVILGSLGKDPTLTGRTDLWDAVLVMIRREPLLGYGYEAFWQGLHGPSAYVWSVIGWSTPHAHNGFLDILLSIGSLGLSVFMVGFIWSYLRSIVWIQGSPYIGSVWPWAYMTFLFFYNLAESTVLRQNDIFWVLYVAVTVSVARGRLASSELRLEGQTQQGTPSRLGTRAASELLIHHPEQGR